MRTVSYTRNAVTAGRPTNNLARRIMATIMAVCALLAITLAMIIPSAEAKGIMGFLCGQDLGGNTEFDGASGNPLADDQSSHKFSIQDMYGSTIHWSTFNGTADPSKVSASDGGIFNGIESGKGAGMSSSKNAGGFTSRAKDVGSAADEVHDGPTCFGRFFNSGVANFNLRLASGLSDVTGLFVSMATNPSIICESADSVNNTHPCINLLAVIGGNSNAGSDGGIIGRLYSGLYQGLIVMAFAAVGMWLLYTGLFKHKLSTAFQGLAWSFLLFAIGVIAMVNPMMVAKAPLQIGTSLGTCAVEGLNGINCFNPNNKSVTANASSGTECTIDFDTNTTLSSQLSIVSRMSVCDVWKAFVLEPWSIGQFGTSYSDMYTGGLNSTQAPWISALNDPKAMNYWKDINVSLYSPEGNKNTTCNDQKSQWRYSNIALYQLSLMSPYHDCSGGAKQVPYHDTTKISTDGRVYADWYYIIDAMYQTKTTYGKGEKDVSYIWGDWYGGHSVERLNVSIISVFAMVMASFVLIPVSVSALMYMFSGIFLMAFASLFLLIGVVPGRGKKIFLGWLQQVLSAILKYFACILWLLVGIQLYSAVLGGSANLGMTFVFIIVVSLIVRLYKKEFVNLIGRVNLGGEEMTNKLGEWMGKKKNFAKDYAKARAGGAVGGFVAGSDNMGEYSGGIKDRAKTLGHNLKQRSAVANDRSKWAGTQKLKQGTGLISSAAKASDQIHDSQRAGAKRQTETSLRDVSQAHNKVKGLVNKGIENLNDDERTIAVKQGADALRQHVEAEQNQALSLSKAKVADATRVLESRNTFENNIDDKVKLAAKNGKDLTIGNTTVSAENAKAYHDYTTAQTQLNKFNANPELAKSKDIDAAKALVTANTKGYKEVMAAKAQSLNDWDAENIKPDKANGAKDYASLMELKNDNDKEIANINSEAAKKIQLSDNMVAEQQLDAIQKSRELNASRQHTHGMGGKVNRNNRRVLEQNANIDASYIDSAGNIDYDAIDAANTKLEDENSPSTIEFGARGKHRQKKAFHNKEKEG